jgi:2,5-dihydroxypyridine 5,6-dioxygenase
MIRFPIGSGVAADFMPLCREGLRRSRVEAGESVVIYADTLTNPQYLGAFLAAAKDLGAEAFQIVQPAIPHDLSKRIGRAIPGKLIVETMKGADFVLDISSGGMLYSSEQNEILATGTRILRVREPEDTLIRLFPLDEIRDRVKRSGERFKRAKRIRITSDEGTDLSMEVSGRPVSIQYGMADEPGRWDHWSTALVTTTPQEDTVEGTLVVSPASILFTIDRYVTEPMKIRFSQGVAVSIDGGAEAIMLRELMETRNEPNCRRVAHVGWGLDHRARWDMFSARVAQNGGTTDARSIYGGVLFALGENRDLGGMNGAPLHVDIALRRARFELDGHAVVENGRILDPTLA